MSQGTPDNLQHELWLACVERLAQDMPEQQFNTWIRPLTARVADDLTCVTVLVGNRFKMDWQQAQQAQSELDGAQQAQACRSTVEPARATPNCRTRRTEPRVPACGVARLQAAKASLPAISDSTDAQAAQQALDDANRLEQSIVAQSQGLNKAMLDTQTKMSRAQDIDLQLAQAQERVNQISEEISNAFADQGAWH